MEFSEATLKKIRRMGKLLNALERVAPALAGNVAFQFFCTPRRQPIRAEDAAFLATAQQEFMVFNRLKISIYTWKSSNPDAKTALLLHGWESNSARWRKHIKALIKAGFTVHAMDAPASGNSQGNRLNALLFSDAVKTYITQRGAPHVIIGHSLGGAAAVLSATLLGATSPSKMILMGVFAESTRVIQDFGTILGANDRVINAIFKAVEKRSGIPITAYSVLEKAALLKDIKGLVIHDADDAVAPVAEGRLVATAWEATYIETIGLGHRLQDKSVVNAIVDFCLKS